MIRSAADLLRAALTAMALAWACSASVTLAAASGVASIAGMPLCFEPSPTDNNGFVARGANFEFSISAAGAEITLRQEKGRLHRGPQDGIETLRNGAAAVHSMGLEFVGANKRATLSADQQLSGKVNYLLGNDPEQWRTDVGTYARVRVRELYPGVDLVYYGNQRQLEYDFKVEPNTDPAVIQMRFEGADEVLVNEQGALALKLGGEVVWQHKPVMYQLANGIRKEINGGYRLLDPRTIGFVVARYDPSLPLVIDPILSYSSYFGGNGNELALAVKVDSQGAIYVAGETLSKVFPAVPTNSPGFQKKNGGGTITGDAFVAKLDNTGSNVIYFTYLGGRVDEAALDLAVDGEGHVFITGFTASPNFPTTTNALSRRIHGTLDPTTSTYPNDAFVAELSADGTALLYSTYLGGAAYEIGGGIALDPAGNVYVTGYTTSANFPIAGGTNVFQSRWAGSYDAFVTKFAPGFTNLVYSTYLGSNLRDEGQGIAADGEGNAYVTGLTSSRWFPITNAIIFYTASTNGTLTNAMLKHLNGSTGKTTYFDAFVTKFTPEGRVAYSTYLGGFYDDYGYRIAVDQQGNAYVTGVSSSLNFPNLHSIPGLEPGYVAARHANFDPFLTKITVGPDGAAHVVYSIFYGGSGEDVGWGVAVDPAGDAFVVGTTYSVKFPTYYTNALLKGTNSGRGDVFITAFNPDATAVLYSDYLGGSGDDFGYGIAVDAQSTAYIVGRTLSTNLPVVPAGQALQRTRVGRSDGFLAKIFMEPILFQNLAGNQLVLSWPPSALTYVLETTPTVSPPAWAPVGVTPAVINGYNTVVLPTSGAGAFFRLRQTGG